MNEPFQTEFLCPKCGSNRWGTSDINNSNGGIGNCHGEGCDFKWPRNEDEKYFHSVSEDSK